MSELVGLFTIGEAANALKVSPATVRRWVRTGLLVPFSGGGRTALYLARALLDAQRMAGR
jgi:DNA-binding transcriptional MerR regulator